VRESDVQGLNMKSITDAMDGHLDNSTGKSFITISWEKLIFMFIVSAARLHHKSFCTELFW
jgi:hypothetical protein